MSRAADAVVIGGGPAGSASAARLAAHGLRVILLERQAEPRPPVCGEFLSAAATAELEDLGVELGALGARRISEVRIATGRSLVSTRLPRPGYAISRTRLDTQLLREAARAGAEVQTGAGVRRLERTSGGWSAALGDGGRIECGTIILATGKHELRGHRRAWPGSPQVVAFKMHVRLRADQAAALGGAVELFSYDGGYAGLQLIDGRTANLCFVVASEHVRGGAYAWPRVLSRLCELVPALGRRLQDARPLYPRPATIAGIPYGYVAGALDAVDDLYRVGDQTAVIPSLAGEGIAIALRSARLAARGVLAGQTSRQYAETVRDEIAGPLRRAGFIEAALRSHPIRGTLAAIAAVPGVLPALARCTRLGVRLGT